MKHAKKSRYFLPCTGVMHGSKWGRDRAVM